VQEHLAYVASVGGYDDLSRVLRFLLTDTVTAPTGALHRQAHEYGQVVLLYEYLAAFVPEADYPIMERAVRAWLHEDRASAWALASQRTTLEAENLFVRVSKEDTGAYRGALEALLARRAPDLGALSPASRLDRIDVPVYLLHGSGDRVIPPEETEWADWELRGREHIALVTPLIEHVEVSGTPRARDQLDLIHFMAQLF
jgi:pimeloyl-ACP methyl ester carboxylesterase